MVTTGYAPRLRRAAPPVAAAVAAGLALLLAFPPYDLWWLAPVGVALLAVALRGRGPRAAAGLAGLAGLVLYLPLLSWTNLHTGRLPWLLLCGLQAAYLAAMGVAVALCAPLARRYPATWPGTTALLWVAQEGLRDRTPFGGFPWGRLAFSQGDSPLLRLAAAGGAPLVGFAVALAGGLLAALAVALAGARGAGRPRWRPVLGPVLAGGVLLGAALAVPTGTPDGPTVRVAIVQGNVPRLGLDFNAQRRAVLDNHATATLALALRVRQGVQPRPDLVLWPENASDIDPLVAQDGDARAVIDRAAAAIGVPILLGAVLQGPGPHARNAGLVWQPGTGPDQVYVKRHPVPFAEYLPLAGIARMVTDKADLAGDFVAGTVPGVLRVGPATVGDVICFEVAYDGLVRDTVTGGADLLVVQTNNATFDAAEARQQLAMVRLRAVEHGRDAVMVSTVGVSGFVDARARVHQLTGFDTAQVEVRELRLGTESTLASELGPVPEYVLLAGATLALVWSLWPRVVSRVRRGRRRPGAGVRHPVVVG